MIDDLTARVDRLERELVEAYQALAKHKLVEEVPVYELHHPPDATPYLSRTMVDPDADRPCSCPQSEELLTKLKSIEGLVTRWHDDEDKTDAWFMAQISKVFG